MCHESSQAADNGVLPSKNNSLFIPSMSVFGESTQVVDSGVFDNRLQI